MPSPRSQMIPGILTSIGQSSPALLQSINDNKAAFLAMMQEPLEGAGGEGAEEGDYEEGEDEGEDDEGMEGMEEEGGACMRACEVRCMLYNEEEGELRDLHCDTLSSSQRLNSVTTV